MGKRKRVSAPVSPDSCSVCVSSGVPFGLSTLKLIGAAAAACELRAEVNSRPKNLTLTSSPGRYRGRSVTA
ncbi:hypothetical protein D9M68_916230 [compost metagenome]